MACGKHDSPEYRVHGDSIVSRPVIPTAQISGDDSVRRDDFTLDAFVGIVSAPANPYADALVIAVIDIRGARLCNMIHNLARLERAAANRDRQVDLVRDGRRIGFANRLREQGRIVSQHAESEAVRPDILRAMRAAKRYRI